MHHSKLILYFSIIISFGGCVYADKDQFSHLYNLKSKTSNEDQAKAAFNVIKRILPDKSDFFSIIIDDKHADGIYDKFTITKIGDVIEIKATSGVVATWGFNYYLKYFCNAHIGWQVKQLNITDVLPDVNITIVSRDKIRYYQNVCTTSYSFVWWNKDNWQNHIDWMALNGLNIALAPHGQEAIWRKVYQSINLTRKEIDDHFSGPAFLSWQRMGNIRGWGGPLSDNWHQHTLELQSFVIQSMQSLGITPALPAFAGFVPKAIKRVFPKAKLSDVEPWNHFSSEYCCPLYLDPTDPLFNYIGKEFLTEIQKQFGSSHIYYSDPFNEIRPTSNDINFLKNVGKAIYQTMIDVDPDSIWLLQNWMFVHEILYWTPDKIEAFLTSVPLGRLLILDLQSEQWPQYERLNMYFGQPFIWNMLHNFGGTLGMFGDTYSINNDVYTARSKNGSTMVGIGITPEGINQNYVMYDLMLETAWNDAPVDINDWIRKYITRRYGMFDDRVYKAWILLMKSVYNFRGLNKMRGKYAITRRPSPDIKPWAWYSKNDLMQSWKLFLTDDVNLKNSEGYKHDVVDITRQVLQYQGDQMYPKIIQAFKQNDINTLKSQIQLFLSLYDELELILSSNHHFLLGNWLNAAKNIAQTKQDKKLFEYNARNQITLWGPNGEIVDYANKQWSGVVTDYFQPRWKIFLAALTECVIKNQKLNMTKVKLDMFNTVEKPFTFDTKVYPTIETGDTFEIFKMLHMKWSVLNADLPDVPIKVNPKPAIHSLYDNVLHVKVRSTEEEDEEIEYEDENLEYNFPHVVMVS
ncbi:N-acetyl-alpha-glucosaminidase [Arctopsyche grandis]|uniref:N-acetyl-alpha-glucosaminidase n=1 Tax=Arctopsyche grandis TaxID=121162 RepID=UPI00406D7C82